MINRCTPCTFIDDVTVAYTVTDDTSDTLVLTITDPCCLASDTKMIRAILGKALCDIAALGTWTFSTDPTDVIGGNCGTVAIFSLAVWDFSNKKVTITMTTITGPASSGNLTVSAPFADTV